MQLMSFCSTPGAIGLIVNTASLVIENRLWKPTYGAKKKCYPAFVHICLGKLRLSLIDFLFHEIVTTCQL